MQKKKNWMDFNKTWCRRMGNGLRTEVPIKFQCESRNGYFQELFGFVRNISRSDLADGLL